MHRSFKDFGAGGNLSQTAVKRAAIFSQVKYQWAPAFIGKAWTEGLAESMRQHLEAHDPLTESILKTCEKEEKEEEKGGMSLLSQVTQICVVVIKGMQGYRNTVSETSWSNCRGKDEEFSSPVQYEHFLLWAKELYLWRQRRFSQQMIQMLDCSAQWDECRNLNAISLTLPG